MDTHPAFESFDDDEEIVPPPALVSMDGDDPETDEIERHLKPIEWGGIIMEILLNPTKVNEIVVAYNTTVEELNTLLKTNKEFQTAVMEVKSRIAAHGPNAGFVLRSQVLAEEMLGTMAKMIEDRHTPHAIRMRGIENAVAWGRMDPRQDKDRNKNQDLGAHVQLNFFGMDSNGPKIVSVESTREIKE